LPNIKDLAKAAGVSITTVSRALNGHEGVNAETRKKIMQLAEQMSYRPNAIARSLVTKRTRTLAVIFSEMSRTSAKSSFAYEMLCGINDRASELKYEILLTSTSPSKQFAISYSDLCLERNVEGAIIFGLRLSDSYLQEIVQMDRFPCVLIDIPLTGKTVGHVTTDNVQGAAKAVKHLLELGHREIAMINGHDDAAVSKMRLQGYRDALESSGLEFRPELVFNGRFTEEGGAEAMYHILLKCPGVTAIFCASDQMLLGAIRTMEKMGLSVPKSISAVGYDDIPIAEYCTPKLTTIRQDKYETGYKAAQLLIDMLEGRTVDRRVVLPNHLIVRESTRSILCVRENVSHAK
jgi:LacI family transcriptional regulator